MRMVQRESKIQFDHVTSAVKCSHQLHIGVLFQLIELLVLISHSVYNSNSA